MVRSGEMMSVEDVLQILAIDLIGIIPEDEDVITATNKGEVLVLDKSSRTGKYYIDIARRINGEEVAIDPIEDTPSLIERISNMFRGGR
jgi:septum site-determining protein MinD